MGGQRRLRFAVTTGFAFGALAVGWPGVAVAQTPPPQIDPLPSREEVTPPVPTRAPPSTVSVDARGAIAQPTCPFVDSPIRLTLNAVTFTRPDGSPLLPQIARAIRGVATPTGDQPIRVVCDLRDRANEALRREGWVASVQIPAQSIETGELRLQIVSARITEIRVRGAPGPYRGVLESRLRQLRALDPLNERDAERALLLASDIPGLDVQLSLRPAGTLPGDVIGDLLISYRPFAILGNAQNYNSRALGRETIYARAELYGLTGLQDVLYVGASTTADVAEQQIVQAGATFGLGHDGITFGPRAVYAWTRPDLGALRLRTTTLIGGFDASAPIRRSLNSNLRFGAGFDYVDQSTTVRTGTAGALPLNLDKLRIFYTRLSGDLTSRRTDGTIQSSLRGGVEFRKGVGLFGATPVNGPLTVGAIPSRVEGNSRAAIARLDVDAQVGLGRFFVIAASARGQYSRTPLLNYEEFNLGNLSIGRGYDPGSNSGDRAIGLRGEVIARLPLRSNAVDTQVFGFYDQVWLTNLDRNSIEVDRRIASFGGGLRAIVFNLLSVEAMYAKPRDRVLLLDKAPPPGRFLVSLTARFDPRAR